MRSLLPGFAVPRSSTRIPRSIAALCGFWLSMTDVARWSIGHWTSQVMWLTAELLMRGPERGVRILRNRAWASSVARPTGRSYGFNAVTTGSDSLVPALG